MAEIVGLSEAVAGLVSDGDSIALEGFTHLIPFAAGHELLRQGRTDLELIRMTPDILYDQMIGVGAGRKLVFSYAGNPVVGSLHRIRDVVEHGWSHPIEIEERVTADEVQEATGWELKIAHNLHTTPAATSEELAALRELISRG